MSDLNDKMPEEGPVTGRASIREVMAAVRAAQQEERRQEALAARKRRRADQDKRAQERRKRHQKLVQAKKNRRQGDLREANTKVAAHVSAASRALSAALRDSTSVPLGRHTPEGREQLRIRRAIEGALGALRQVGKGTFYNADIDLDFDDVSA